MFRDVFNGDESDGIDSLAKHRMDDSRATHITMGYTLTFIKVDSPAQPENNAQAQGNDNPVVIELPYPAVRLDIAQSFAYIPQTRIWAAFLCASFYDADDNELWHTELLVGSFPELAHHREALEFFGPDPESNGFSPLDNRTHNFNHVRAHHATLIPENRTVPDPNNEHSTITIPHFPQGNININMSGGWNPRSGYDAGNANGGPPLNGLPGFNGIPVSASGYPNPANAIPVPPFAQQAPVYTMSPHGYQQLAPGMIPPAAHVQRARDARQRGQQLPELDGRGRLRAGLQLLLPGAAHQDPRHQVEGAPWRLAPGMSMWFGAYHVPCNLTLGDMMKGFGATNADAKKNRITEVNPGGGGKWYKGVTWTGDDKDKMKLTLKEVGWDHSRVGNEKPVVWVWITNT
ncbi:hypothetical protein PG999_014277 [Apiospora kogelbergensis]|uniref:Uncharacterized protein n=1 Tax=Apiospora kogelbergensis TaxID=1337665 RepID=A0AAW0Q9J0_9PEZI